MKKKLTEAEQACVNFYRANKDKQPMRLAKAKILKIGHKLSEPQTFEITICPDIEGKHPICNCGQVGGALCYGARIAKVQEVEDDG